MATVLFLTVGSQDARVEAMLYSLADGPLAAALIAWQCSWVFSSPSHSISVLLHLLPGLALFVHRHMDAPLSAVGVVQHIASLLPHRAPAGCAPPADLAVRPRCLRRSSSEYILSSCLCIVQRTASLVLHCAPRFARPRQTSRCAMAACAALCEVVLKPRFNLPALLPLLHPRHARADHAAQADLAVRLACLCSLSMDVTCVLPLPVYNLAWYVFQFVPLQCYAGQPLLSVPLSGCLRVVNWLSTRRWHLCPVCCGHLWRRCCSTARGSCHTSSWCRWAACRIAVQLSLYSTDCNWLFTAQNIVCASSDCLSNGLCFDTLQVIFRRFILAHKYETSYIALARRAARTNNFWNRLVRKGSVMRRCAVFGALPLA